MVTSALLVVLIAQTPPLTGERSVVSQCEVATDSDYGYSKEKPIKVGGTPMFGPARQRRFLSALAGPGGQPVSFRRRGSLKPNAEDIILDLYEVTYPGLEKPIELYLDLYRWDPPKAPMGLLCARAIGLEPTENTKPGEMPPPPPPPAPPRAGPPPGGFPRIPPWSRFVDFAIAVGKVEELPPIPLDPNGSTRYGVAFDPFTMVSRTMRATGSVPDQMRDNAFQRETLIVAFPLVCDGVTATPVDVSMAYNGRTMSRSVDVLKGDALKKRTPAYAVPDGAIGVMMSGSSLLPGQLTIRYDRAPCGGARDSVDLAVSRQSEPPARVAPVWPEGVPVPPEGVVRVTLHALIDSNGVPTEITVADGPEPFHAAAIAAMKAAVYPAHRINGVPSRSPRPVATTISFMPPR